eukprot:Unigene8118_Nuclearia_a/m.24909 Unigene8118_Nuclearia_a/g.24909  ORF Unigene8118_Nuclearia_a/g.24909 Unigene8118_Nuclearia_a/m.24909 type:complete len:162 (+) Unigene8118_Nuclearia_a:696-1181(+)
MVKLSAVDGSTEEVREVTGPTTDELRQEMMHQLEQVVEGMVEEMADGAEEDDDDMYEDEPDEDDVEGGEEDDADDADAADAAKDDAAKAGADGAGAVRRVGARDAAGRKAAAGGKGGWKDFVAQQIVHPSMQVPNLLLLMNVSLFAASIWVSQTYGYLLAL